MPEAVPLPDIVPPLVDAPPDVVPLPDVEPLADESVFGVSAVLPELLPVDGMLLPAEPDGEVLGWFWWAAGWLLPGDTLVAGGQSVDDELLPAGGVVAPEVCARAAGAVAVASPKASASARNRLMRHSLLPAFAGSGCGYGTLS